MNRMTAVMVFTTLLGAPLVLLAQEETDDPPWVSVVEEGVTVPEWEVPDGEPPANGDEEIDLFDIAGQTLEPQTLERCINWEVVGACFFYTYPSKIDVSIKVKHYNPDFVVSSHYFEGGNPWKEVNLIYADAANAIGESMVGGVSPLPLSGHGNTEPKPHQRTTNLAFREVDVIGAPLTGFLERAASSYFCPSETRPYHPYYLSQADAYFWRISPLELLWPQSWIPGLAEVGPWPVDRWGSVFPRKGFLVQANPWRAGVVTSMRGADIVTRGRLQAHIYIPSETTRTGSKHVVWWPEVVTADPRDGIWQPLYPEAVNECVSYGPDAVSADPSNAVKLTVSKARMAHQLWRPYRCCEQKGAMFLFDIDFE